MQLNTFDGIVNAVVAHCKNAPVSLARLWVVNAFREYVDSRMWSWKIGHGQIIVPDAYTTGTAAAQFMSNVVTGTSTVWDSTMIGRQFRIVGSGGSNAIYTVVDVISPTQLRLDRPWGSADVAATSYEIWLAYVTVPNDFQSWLSVIDPAQGYQLAWGVSKAELDQRDPQRSNSGTPYVLANATYSPVAAGSVGSVLQVHGSGPAPFASGVYTGADDGVFSIEITLGGATGTAEYQWRKDDGTLVTGVVTDSDGQELDEGVSVYWPTGSVYVLGDVFVVACKAALGAGLPRFELWPHRKNQTVYPTAYERRLDDPDTDSFQLPRYVRGNILMFHALAQCANWPGEGETKNPYYDPSGRLARENMNSYLRLLEKEQRLDDDIFSADVSYYQNVPFAAPFDAAWAQRHS